MLDQGVVPAELLQVTKEHRNDELVVTVVNAYLERATALTDSDSELLSTMRGELVDLRVSGVTFQWVEGWVRRMKVGEKTNYAPSTIRKRVGALARVLDWHFRQITPPNEMLPGNPLRALPRGYSAYTSTDAREALRNGLDERRDTARAHRLGAEVEARIERILAGEKRPDRERPWPTDPHFEMLYRLIVDTGLRLFEAYRMTVDQIDYSSMLLNVKGSKGRVGETKERFVVLKPELGARLKAYCKAQGRKSGERIFPFWDGRRETRANCSSRLSARFKTLFDYAGAPHLVEHDLRHEATCRWVTLQKDGRWVFSSTEICQMMGWTDMRMMLRYASLRGSDLSGRL
jgi:integrase